MGCHLQRSARKAWEGDLSERRRNCVLEGASLRGEPNAAPGAREERRAEIRLQFSDLLADRRLGQVQIFRRAGEAFQPRGGFEGDERVERGQALAKSFHK